MSETCEGARAHEGVRARHVKVPDLMKGTIETCEDPGAHEGVRARHVKVPDLMKEYDRDL